MNKNLLRAPIELAKAVSTKNTETQTASYRKAILCVIVTVLCTVMRSVDWMEKRRSI